MGGAMKPFNMQILSNVGYMTLKYYYSGDILKVPLDLPSALPFPL